MTSMFQSFQAFNCWSVTRVRWMSPWSTTTLAAWPGDSSTRVTWWSQCFFGPEVKQQNDTENKILVICCDVVFCVQNALRKKSNNVCKHDALDSVEIKRVGPMNLISPRSAGIASLTIQGRTFSEAGLAVLASFGAVEVQAVNWEVEFLFFSTFRNYTLQGTNISHLGKRKIIFKIPFLGDMLVPWRVLHAFCFFI